MLNKCFCFPEVWWGSFGASVMQVQNEIVVKWSDVGIMACLLHANECSLLTGANWTMLTIKIKPSQCCVMFVNLSCVTSSPAWPVVLGRGMPAISDFHFWCRICLALKDCMSPLYSLMYFPAFQSVGVVVSVCQLETSECNYWRHWNCSDHLSAVKPQALWVNWNFIPV